MSSTRVPAALRRRVQERARGCCEYCLLSEEDAWLTHEPDHIIAEKHGGETTVDNLAWACFDCNRHKGSDIASRDSATGSLAPLFDPRSQSWRDHFELSEGRIVGLTAIGRVSTETIELSDSIEARALTLEARGFKAFDALHIASAEAGRVDYFCSCDDRLLKKARGQLDLMTRVVSPLELAKDLFS